MTRDKIIEKLKNKKMKNNAMSPEIASYIAGWNEALGYAIDLLKKD
jgi:hypothetical protein